MECKKKSVMIVLAICMTLALAGCGPLMPTDSLSDPNAASTNNSPDSYNTNETAEEFLDRYNNEMTWEEQFHYESIGFINSEITQSPDGFIENQEEYTKAAIEYIERYFEKNGIGVPEDARIITSEQDWFNGGKSGVAYLTEIYTGDVYENGITNTSNSKCIGSLLEIQSSYLDGNPQFPQRIAYAFLLPEQNKTIDIQWLGKNESGIPNVIGVRYYVPNVPVDESESNCYLLTGENGALTWQEISLDDWKEKDGSGMIALTLFCCSGLKRV